MYWNLFRKALELAEVKEGLFEGFNPVLTSPK
jgi:hypothetical protein